MAGFSRRALLIAAPAIISGGWGKGFGAGYDEILQIGDSNSYGGLNIDGTPSYNPAIETTDNRCCEWRSSIPNQARSFTIISDSYHPYDYYTSITQSAIDGVGPGENFVKAWANNFMDPLRKVRITAQGVGGTGLCTSTPGFYGVTPTPGLGISTAIGRINGALAQSSSNRLVCILWTTGANDAINAQSLGITQSQYENAFADTIAYLRANIVGTGASTAPVLVQPLVPLWAAGDGGKYIPIRDALANLPNIVSRCGYADPTGQTVLGETAIPFHLCGDAQRLIGSTLFVNAYNTMSP